MCISKYILLVALILLFSCNTSKYLFHEEDFELLNDEYHIYIEKGATNNQKLYVLVELPNKIQSFMNCLFEHNLNFTGFLATIKSYKFYVYKSSFKCVAGECNGLINYDDKRIFLESTLCAVSHELCHLWMYKYYGDKHTDPSESRCKDCYK